MVRRRPSEIAAQLGMPVWQWNTFMAIGLLALPVFALSAAIIALEDLSVSKYKKEASTGAPVRARHMAHGLTLLPRRSQLN